MPERKRGRRLGIFLVAAVAVTADLFAIASGQAVTTKFPQPLHLIQQYPWPSVAIFSVIGVVLAVFVFLHDDAGSGSEKPAVGRQGREEADIKSSKFMRSAIRVLKGTHVKVRKSKFVDSPVTTYSDNTPSGSS
jgi:hypothetical protein